MFEGKYVALIYFYIIYFHVLSPRVRGKHSTLKTGTVFRFATRFPSMSLFLHPFPSCPTLPAEKVVSLLFSLPPFPLPSQPKQKGLEGHSIKLEPQSSTALQTYLPIPQIPLQFILCQSVGNSFFSNCTLDPSMHKPQYLQPFIPLI